MFEYASRSSSRAFDKMQGLEAVAAAPVRVDRLLHSVEPTTVVVALAVVLAVIKAAEAALALQGPVEAEAAPAPGGVLGEEILEPTAAALIALAALMLLEETRS